MTSVGSARGRRAPPPSDPPLYLLQATNEDRPRTVAHDLPPAHLLPLLPLVTDQAMALKGAPSVMAPPCLNFPRTAATTTSLIIHTGAPTVNTPSQYLHVTAGKGMRESMKSHIYACRMDRWNILCKARCAHSATNQIPTRSIKQDTMCQFALVNSGNPLRNRERPTW